MGQLEMSSDARLAAAADAESLVRAGAPGTHAVFDQLARTIWRLRQPDGCPWDKEQTHESIAKNMLEEAYEAYDTIVEHDAAHLKEELGDVLMQVLLHAQISADAGGFDIDDVCRELNEKLVRRHPHVFGANAAGAGAAGDAQNAEQVLNIWEEVKRAEREGAADTNERPQGLLDSVPKSMPALMQAQKVSKRAAKAGFEWESVADVWAKVEEEKAEFLAEPRGSEEASEEFGDLLFALVNVARWEGVDAEAALAHACEKFRLRFGDVEQLAAEDGNAVEELTTAQLDALWNRAKQSR